MAKRYFRITISGYGGEIVLGRLTEEQFDFWSPMEEENIVSHAMWDPWEENDENPIFDDEDPRWLGQWYELDDIAHENGADEDHAYVSVDEVDGDQYDSIHITEVLNLDFKELVEKYKPVVDRQDLDLDEELYPNGFYEDGDNEGEPKPLDNGTVPTPYVFFGMSSEKGTFGDYLVITDGEDFDPAKMYFTVTGMPNGDALVYLQEYNNEPVDNNGGDTNGKGYYAQVWDW